jgi:predicted transcriptional regulator
MARPRRYEERRVATAVRLPESVHRRLREAAAERDVSANLIVTRAVTDFLDRLPTADVARGEPGRSVDAGASEGSHP